MLDALKRHPKRSITIGILLTVVLFLLKYFVFWSPGQIDHLFANDKNSPIVVAHRGASKDAPENTLAAFNKAIEMGADAVELDVQLSADGEAVIFHDFAVDRTTDGSGNVEDMTLAELRKLDAGSWFDPQFKGERIPTLKEAIELIDGRAKVFVELKTEAKGDFGLEKRVIEVVKETGSEHSTIMISFNPISLIHARRRFSGVPIGLLYANDTPDFLRERKFAPLIHPQALLPGIEMATGDHVAKMLDRGHRVIVWTVNEPEQMERMISMGADGIITDTPDVALKLLGR